MATKCRYRGARRANLYRLGADGLEPITMVMVEFRRGRAAEKRLALGSVSLVAISLPVPLRSTSSTSGGQVFRSKPLACLWHCHACNTATRNPEWAGRAPPAATTPPRRRAWLRIFVVRCGLPCDPPVGGHSCNGGTIPRFHRAVRRGLLQNSCFRTCGRQRVLGSRCGSVDGRRWPATAPLMSARSA